MKLIDYIRLRKTSLIVLLIIASIYILTFYLYGFPLTAVVYPFLLGAVLSAVVVTANPMSEP